MNEDIKKLIENYSSVWTTLKEWDEGVYDYETDNYVMKLLIIKQRFKEEEIECVIHLPETEHDFPYIDFENEKEIGWFDWNVFDKMNIFIIQNKEDLSTKYFESESLKEAIDLVLEYLKVNK